MEGEELREYYDGMTYDVVLQTNFIDYNNIGNPFQTYLKGSFFEQVDVDKPVINKILLRQNKFDDMTARFSLIENESEMQYLTSDEFGRSQYKIGSEETIVSIQVMLSERVIIQRR